MRIAQVSFAETGGGAERVATDLHECFLAKGHDAVLLTPRPDPHSERAGVVAIDVDASRPAWQRALMRIDRRLARPHAAARRRRGFDDTDHPWTAGLLDLLPWAPEPPDVLHLHNLHGGWFDLQQLGPLSHRVPTVITLHDAWLPLGGPHWPMHVDAWDADALRANNVLREAALRDASLTIVSPSRWMKGVWDRSPWSLKVGDAVVIANGIDLEVFNPRGASADRAAMGVGDGARLVMQVGLTGRGTPSHTLPEELLSAAEFFGHGPRGFVACNVGVEVPRDRLRRWSSSHGGAVRVIQTGRISDRLRMAELYRAADVVYHAVAEDNFPSVVLEAMACGTPVAASPVGGIPEQFEHDVHGWHLGPGALEGLASVLRMTDDPQEVRARSAAAAEHARQHFDRRRMADDYLGLYEELHEARVQ